MSQSDKDSITVSGCLKAYDEATMGAKPSTSGSAQPTSVVGKFLLTNVKSETATPSATTPSTPPPSATSTMHDVKQYVVTAGTGVNLSAHLNHQVRITGTKMAPSSMTRPDASRPGEPKPGDPSQPSAAIITGEKHGNMDIPSLTATSVTMVSSTCTGATE